MKYTSRLAGWLNVLCFFLLLRPILIGLSELRKNVFSSRTEKREEGGRAGKESEGKRQGESVQAKLKRAPRGAGGTLCTRLPLLGIKKAEISLCVERGWKF